MEYLFILLCVLLIVIIKVVKTFSDNMKDRLINDVIESELINISCDLDGLEYSSYGEFEDEVAKLVYLKCPTAQKTLDDLHSMFRSEQWRNYRNFIRENATITFNDIAMAVPDDIL